MTLRICFGLVVTAALGASALAAPAAPIADADFAGVVSGAFKAFAPKVASLAASFDNDDLRDMLRDRDPEIRKAALVAARGHMNDSRIRDQVRDMARGGGEETGVRREAARTLLWGSHDSDIRRVLMDLARGERDLPVRVMACKALYFAAASDSGARDLLVDLAEREREAGVRLAAIWALFNSVHNSDARDALKDIAFSSSEPVDARLEALKSLYGAMNHSDIRDKVYDLARYSYGAKSLRVAAVYALSAAAGDSRVRDLLEDMARRESDQELRLAAIKAQSHDVEFFRAYFHLGYRLHPHGAYISPIVT